MSWIENHGGVRQDFENLFNYIFQLLEVLSL